MSESPIRLVLQASNRPRRSTRLSQSISPNSPQLPLTSVSTSSLPSSENIESGTTLEQVSEDYRRYQLSLVQQPLRAPASGLALNVLSRLPIIPAPVVQLKIMDKEGNEIDPSTLIAEVDHYFCSSSLLDADSDQSMDIVEILPSATAKYHRQLQTLVGTTVADLRQITSLQGQDVLYFTFGDLSVRTTGKFKIKFFLGKTVNGSRASLASVTSSAFEVQELENYAGGQDQDAITELSQHLLDSGVRLYMPPL